MRPTRADERDAADLDRSVDRVPRAHNLNAKVQQALAELPPGSGDVGVATRRVLLENIVLYLGGAYDTGIDVTEEFVRDVQAVLVRPAE